MQGQELLLHSEYYYSICESMNNLSLLDNTLFVGQQVGVKDFYGTLKDVPLSERIEMPVAEEMQMGFCIGLALGGFLPVCIYQRMDFMYRAMDSLCNHLSILPECSKGIFKPKVIIRTTIGNNFPINPGPQHTQDLTAVFQKALKFPVIKVTNPKDVFEVYNMAIEGDTSIMIVEDQNLYLK